MTPPGKERTTATALKPLSRPAAESENSVSIVMTASELAMSICVQWLALYGFLTTRPHAAKHELRAQLHVGERVLYRSNFLRNCEYCYAHSWILGMGRRASGTATLNLCLSLNCSSY